MYKRRDNDYSSEFDQRLNGNNSSKMNQNKINSSLNLMEKEIVFMESNLFLGLKYPGYEAKLTNVKLLLFSHIPFRFILIIPVQRQNAF